MSTAAMWGTSVGYTDFGDTIMIETVDSRVAHVRQETFDYLYTRLSEHVAALKENCIEYTIFDPNRPLYQYPNWFVEAKVDGVITDDLWIVDGKGLYVIFQDDGGEIVMAPGAVILRNFMGELRYMERDDFERYYETKGGI
jgi:hypothetical protein